MTVISNIPVGTVCRVKCFSFLDIRNKKEQTYLDWFVCLKNSPATHFILKEFYHLDYPNNRCQLTFLNYENLLKSGWRIDKQSKVFEANEPVYLIQKYNQNYVKICIKSEFYNITLDEKNWELEKI